jgi:hypothetical protein
LALPVSARRSKSISESTIIAVGGFTGPEEVFHAGREEEFVREQLELGVEDPVDGR